jgi:uncharacterized protein
MKFSYKIYRHEAEIILAIADFSVLGKTLHEGDLEFEVNDFYRGETCDEKAALKLIRGATIVNAVGRDIIGLMTKECLVSEKTVLSVAGVPHAQIISIR